VFIFNLVFCFIATQDDNTTERISALEAQVSALRKQLKGSNATSLLRDNMYKEAIIHQNVFKLFDTDVIQKEGSPTGWDETSYVSNVWNLFNILNIGAGVNGDGNGLKVNIPKGYDVLWVRILNDRWATFRVCPFVNGSPEYSAEEKYASGFRLLNGISPDGAAPDAQWNVHLWVPIPIRGKTQQLICSTLTPTLMIGSQESLSERTFGTTQSIVQLPIYGR